MKKGLLLALTMVMLGALVLPASAKAPQVTMPSIIIGSANETSGTKHLFTSLEAVNLADPGNVKQMNGDTITRDQLHFYYMTGQTGVIKASSRTALIPEVDMTDLAAIPGGTLPASGKQIPDSNVSDADLYWLALINDGLGRASATTAYAALPATHGATLAEYGNFITTGTQSNAIDLTIVAAETDAPTTYGMGTFTVYSIPNAADGVSEGAIMQNDDFNDGADGWVYATDPRNAGDILIPPIPSTPGLTSLPLTAQHPTSGVYHGMWHSAPAGTADIDVKESDFATGGIIEADLTLTASDATLANVMPYRILYYNLAYSHIGGMANLVTDPASQGAYSFAPVSGTPQTVKLFWYPPFNMTQMGDGELVDGRMADTLGTDNRDYYLSFEGLDLDPTDSGSLALDNSVVKRISRPAQGTLMKAWGTGGTAFNATTENGGWNMADSSPGMLTGGWTNGIANATAGSIVLSGRPEANGSYKQVAPYGSGAGMPSYTPNTLVHMNVKMATADVNATPGIRVLLLPGIPTEGAKVASPIIWVDSYDSNPKKAAFAAGPSGTTVTGFTTPQKDQATDIDVYYFTQSSLSSAFKMVPTIDVIKYAWAANDPLVSAPNWPNVTANLTISGVTMHSTSAQ